MVAVVSGNGLGLYNSSLSQLGMLFGGQAGIGQSRESQMVNIANGNLLLQDLDTFIDVRGFEAQALRTYNSFGQVTGVGQDGFITGYERYVTRNGTLNTAGSTLTLTTGDGQTVVFTYSGTANKYVSSAGGGANDTMTWASGTHQWTYLEGSSQRQELYADPSDTTLKGRLLRIRNLKSDSATPAEFDVIYDANNRISEIRSVDGSSDPTQSDAIIYGYDASGRLASISTREAGVVIPRVTYAYDNLGRLKNVLTNLTPSDSSDDAWNATASANDGHLFETTYNYVSSTDPNNLQIANVVTSDGVCVAYTYDANGRIKTVSQGGQTVTFTYNSGSTDVTDAAGRTWTYAYDANGQLTSVTEPAVNGQRQLTTYTYNSNGDVTRISKLPYAGQPATLDTIFEYDPNGNRTLQRDQLGNTITWTYSSVNQVLSETHFTGVDPDGLDPTETNALGAPAGAMTTNYVYDSTNRLVYTVDPMGEVRQFAYYGSGNVGIGQLTTDRRYYGATYTSTDMSLTALNAWAASGVKANSALTTYNYDAKGRISQVLGFANVSASGSGTADAYETITNFTYNAQGQLLQQVLVHGTGRSSTVTPSGSTVTDYVYDGMGRLLGSTSHDSAVSGASITDANSVQTTYAYLDSGHTIVTTFDSGLVQTQVRNAAGQVVSVSQVDAVTGPTQLTRTTQNFYDAAGLLRATQDATGAITYLFYDNDARLIATVDATGAVAQTVYDEIGRVKQTIAYATGVSTGGWLSGSTVTKDTLVFASSNPGSLPGNQAWVQTDTAHDRTTTVTYDNGGRLKTQTDPSGLVTCTSYDGASRVTSIKVYRPDDATVTPRITYYYYDNAGHPIAVVDPAGYMTESVYDNAGRVVQTIRYATVTTGGATLQRPASSANDVVTRYFYDGRHLVGELDYVGNDGSGGTSNGYLTTYDYDETANQTTVYGYRNLLTGLDGTQTLAALKTAATTSYRTTKKVYNALGQLAQEVNVEGTFTNYSYDEAGRLVRTVVQDLATSPTTSREDDLRLDAWGEVIGEIRGEQAVNAMAAVGGLALNDPTLTTTQRNTIWSGAYGSTNSYDADGRLTQTVDALGHRTWFFYDARGRQTTVVRGIADASGNNPNSRGEVTRLTYDAFGQIVSRTAYTTAQAIATPTGTPTWSDWYANVQTMLASLSVGGTDSVASMTYDQRGLLVQSVDAEGAIRSYNYTAFGQLNQETDFVGTSSQVTMQHAYDLRGLETGRTDALGTTLARSVSRTYDAFGRVTTSTDALGLVTTFAYDRLGRQISHSATIEGRTETFSTTYDAFARVLTQTDALGNTTSYVYSDSARNVQMTTAEGIVVRTTRDIYGDVVIVLSAVGTALQTNTTYTYDHDGHLKTTTNPIFTEVTTNTYDALGELLQTTDASGRVVSYTYDAVGRVLTRTLDPGSGHLALMTSYCFDAQGRQIKVTDATGLVTTTSYDRNGRVVTVALDPSGQNLRTTYTWDAAGRQHDVTQGAGTANATKTRYCYDLLGRRTSETLDPDHVNLTTHYGYDANDHLIARTDALGNVTRYVYDQGGELRCTIDATGGVTEYRYDIDGRQAVEYRYAMPIATGSLGTAPTVAQVLALVNPSTSYQSTYRIYDKDGRLRFTVDGLGDVQETRYDVAGRAFLQVGYTVPVTLYSWDVSLLSTGSYPAANFATDKNLAAQAGSANLQYRVLDDDGRVRFTVDALGNATEMRYDLAGRVVTTRVYATPVVLSSADLASLQTGTLTTAKMATYLGTTPQSLASITYSVYDAAGRLRFQLDAMGNVQEWRYDAAGRVLEQLAYLSPLTILVADKNAMVVGTYADTTLAARSDLTSQAATALVTWTVHDTAGRTRFTVDALGEVKELRYDAAGRVVETLTYVTALALSSADKTALTNGTYTAAAFAARSDLTSQCAQAMATWQVYDSAGRARFTVDSLGDVSEVRYDAAGRTIGRLVYVTPLVLTSADNAALAAGTMDAATLASRGELVSQAATVNASYSILDAAGRVRFQVDGLGDVQEMRYDGEGRLITQLAYATPLALSSADLAALATGTCDVAAFAARADLTGQEAAANQTWHLFDASGRLRFAIDAAGGVSEWRYDGQGRVVEQLGYGVFYPLSSADRAAAATSSLDPDTFATRLWANWPAPAPTVSWKVYDQAGRLRFNVDGLGEVTEQRYDGIGRVVEQLGYATAIALDTTTQNQLAAGTFGAVAMAALGSLTSQEANAHATYNLYDTGNHLRYTVTRALVNGSLLGTVTENRYDATGRVVAQVRYAPTVAFDPTQTVSSLASLITAAGGNTAANQRITRMVYDGSGRQRFTLSNNGAVTESRYDAAGRVKATCIYGTLVPVTNYTEATLMAAVAAISDNRIVTDGYDTAGRLTSITDALNQTESYTYDGAGHRLTLTNKLQNTWTYKYDAAGRQIEIHTPQVSVLRFDANGNLLPASTESLVTKIAYDANGHVVSRTEAWGTPEARTTQYVYDSRGNQIQTIFPPAGAVDNATGQWVAGGASTDTEVTYDAMGRAVVSKDTRGNYSYKAYDAQGRLAYELGADGYVTGYTYDALGEQTTMSRYAWPVIPQVSGYFWSAGQPASLSVFQSYIDSMNSNLNCPPPRVLTTTYDAAGRKQSVMQSAVTYTLADGTTATGSPTTVFTYDAYGQLVKEAVLLQNASGSQPTIWATTYHYYDTAGHKTMDVDPAGYVTAWTYDAQGEVTQETQYARALSASVLSTLTTTTPPAAPAAGDATIGFDRITRCTYDALGRKATETNVSVHYENSTGSELTRDVLTTIGYDAINEVTSNTVDGQVTSMTFDALGHQTSVKQPERSVLVNGYNGLLTGTGGASLDLGSTALYAQSSPYMTIAYDAFGHQVQVVRYANGWKHGDAAAYASADDQVQTMQYDGQGRAVITVDANGNRSYRHYDGADNLIEVDTRLDEGDGRWAEVKTLATYDGANRQLTTIVWRTVHTPVEGGETVVDPVTDLQTQVVYNPYGEIELKGDPTSVANWYGYGSPVLHYTYDAAGRMVTENHDGGVHTIGYNLAGHQITDTHWTRVDTWTGGGIYSNDVQVTTRNVNDILGRVLSAIGPVATVSQTVDRWGNAIEAIDALGNVTDMQYNQFNQMVDQKQPTVDVMSEGGVITRPRPEIHAFYDALGRQVGMSDADGHVTQIGLDAVGRKVSITDGVGNTTRMAYDALDQQRLGQNGLGYLTWQGFDHLGQVVAMGDYLPTGTTRTNATLQTFTLDQNGDRIQVSDAMGVVSRYDFDSRKLLLRSQTAMGVVMNYAYDANGNKVLEEDGDASHVGVMTWNYDALGRETAHRDLSGHHFYSFTYDGNSGQLWEEVGNDGNEGVNMVRFYGHDIGGRNTIIYDEGPLELYTYDAAGNRTSEEIVEATTNYPFSPTFDVKTTITYDEHNRIKTVSETDVTANVNTMFVSYAYDAQGNRRNLHAQSAYGAPQDAWFSYDADNRVQVVDGAVVNGHVAVVDGNSGSYQQFYDAAGDMIGTETYCDVHVGSGKVHLLAMSDQLFDLRGHIVATTYPHAIGDLSAGVMTTNAYDLDGRVTETRTFDEAYSNADYTGSQAYVGGTLKSDDQYTYDADGRMLVQTQYQRTDDPSGKNDWSWTLLRDPGTGDFTTSGAYAGAGSITLTSIVSYVDVNHDGTLGYDSLGRATGYTYWIKDDTTATYRYTYTGFESWLTSTVRQTFSDTNKRAVTSEVTYDGIGREISIIEKKDANPGELIYDNARYFQYDINGQILHRLDGLWYTGDQVYHPGTGGDGEFWTGTDAAAKSTTFAMYANGEEIASVNGKGDIDALSHVTGFQNTQAGTTQVVVSDGDTLQTLAQRVYGDSNLWYILASANGLDSTSKLEAGTTLSAPQVKTTVNDASTFKPYNPTDVTGAIEPAMPKPPEQGCGLLGMIIMIVVMVVVSYLTAGAATTFFAGIMGEGLGATMAGAAVGGFVGSVASQGVGLAMGNIQHFSLKQAAAAGISAGLMAGLGEVTSGISSSLDEAPGGYIVKGAMQAVEGSLTTYAANKIVGIKGAFSWKDVAASAVTGAISAGITHVITGANGLNVDMGTAEGQFESGFVGNLVKGAVGAGVRDAFGLPGKFNLGQMVADAFGNALGDFIDGSDEKAAENYTQKQQLAEAWAELEREVGGGTDDAASTDGTDNTDASDGDGTDGTDEISPDQTYTTSIGDDGDGGNVDGDGNTSDAGASDTAVGPDAELDSNGTWGGVGSGEGAGNEPGVVTAAYANAGPGEATQAVQLGGEADAGIAGSPADGDEKLDRALSYISRFELAHTNFQSLSEKGNSLTDVQNQLADYGLSLVGTYRALSNKNDITAGLMVLEALQQGDGAGNAVILASGKSANDLRSSKSFDELIDKVRSGLMLSIANTATLVEASKKGMLSYSNSKFLASREGMLLNALADSHDLGRTSFLASAATNIPFFVGWAVANGQIAALHQDKVVLAQLKDIGMVSHAQFHRAMDDINWEILSDQIQKPFSVLPAGKMATKLGLVSLGLTPETAEAGVLTEAEKVAKNLAQEALRAGRLAAYNSGKLKAFSLAWNLRGNLIEDAALSLRNGISRLGNFPVIDGRNIRTGAIISVKSVDLQAIRSLNPATLQKVLESYVDSIAKFAGDSKYVRVGGQKILVTIKSSQILSRELVLGYNPLIATAEQNSVMSRVASYAAKQNVTFTPFWAK